MRPVWPTHYFLVPRGPPLPLPYLFMSAAHKGSARYIQGATSTFCWLFYWDIVLNSDITKRCQTSTKSSLRGVGQPCVPRWAQTAKWLRTADSACLPQCYRFINVLQNLGILWLPLTLCDCDHIIINHIETEITPNLLKNCSTILIAKVANDPSIRRWIWLPWVESCCLPSHMWLLTACNSDPINSESSTMYYVVIGILIFV